MRITQVIGGIDLHVLTCARANVPLFASQEGWADYADIWWVAIDKYISSATYKVKVGERLHVCLFRVSGMAGRIALKFGV